MLTNWDRVLIAFILSAAGFSFILLPDVVGAGGGRLVVVTAGSAADQAFNIETDKIIETGPSSESCVVEISGGRVRVKKSSCPKRLCLSKGWISQVGQSVVCLPHRVVVSVMSTAQSGSEPDAVIR